MTGHKQIVALRQRGMRPQSVFVADYRGKGEWELAQGGHPAVFVGGDDPQLTDLRFLAGSRVHLHSDGNASRAMAWVDRLLIDGVNHIIQLTDGEVTQWRQ